MNSIKLKLHSVPGHPANGKTIVVPADDRGVPLDPFWRRRLRDAEHDKCVEIVKPKEQERVKK